MILAKRYDTQVEVLFNGTANAMRRRPYPSYAKPLPDAISATYEFSISAVAQGAFWIFSSKSGRGSHLSVSTCLSLTSNTPNVT